MSVQLATLLEKASDTVTLECWQRKLTTDALTRVAVRLHTPGGSLRETAAILRLLGVERSNGAVWSYIVHLTDDVPDLPSAQPTQFAVSSTAVRINGEWPWVYDAIKPDSKCYSMLPGLGDEVPIRRLRSSTVSPRNMTGHRRCF